MTKMETCTGLLTIDLDALVDNWLLLKGKLNGADCGAAIKADAYGLGADQAVLALNGAGCREFFVALIEEGIQLRKTMDDAGRDARIHILGGPNGIGAPFIEYRLTPALNSLEDIAFWKNHHPDTACDVHIDTGMLRLGLSPMEVDHLRARPELTQGLNVFCVLTHLACAEDSETEMNARQLREFKAARTLFPMAKASFTNSSGIFLGPEYHFDLARPGIALYGANPTPNAPNPMAQVIRLQGKILQVRDVDTPQTVGYGATHRIERKGRIATVGVGYADGYIRSLSLRGIGYLGDYRVPVVGRVSMDLITFDISDVPENIARQGAWIDLIGPCNPVDDVAEAAGTIGYEILTSLGPRYHRVYKGQRDQE